MPVMPEVTNRLRPTGGVTMPISMFTDHDDAQVDGVDAQALRDREEDRREDQDDRRSAP